MQCRQCGLSHDPFVGCAAAARMQSANPEDKALVGSIVANRYRVTDVVGRGASGTVFAVQPLAFARPFVMKVLRPRWVTPDVVSRVFHGEARAAWGVAHPCLCEVVDVGVIPAGRAETDGSPFIVTERCEGETLADRIARDPMSVAATVDVMMQLLSALVAVHAHNLVVRDLRPQNIFLAHRRGCRPLLKLLDFGLARLVPLDRVKQVWSPTNTQVGTIPYYMSPERVRSEVEVEVAHDLFVASIVMYEALTGQRPFAAPTFDGIVSALNNSGRVPLVTEVRRDLPPELGGFIMRGLSPNPKARFASAKEMQDELRGVFEGARKGSSVIVAAAPAAPSSITIQAGPVTSDHPPPGELGSIAPSLPPHKPSRPPEKEEETKMDVRSADIARIIEAVERESDEMRQAADPREEMLPATHPIPRTPEIEEEETETMKVSPQMRRQIEDLTANKPGLPRALPVPVPPPPPRRRP